MTDIPKNKQKAITDASKLNEISKHEVIVIVEKIIADLKHLPSAKFSLMCCIPSLQISSKELQKGFYC